MIRLPLLSLASVTITPELSPLIILFLLGKFCGAGFSFISYSVITAPPEFIMLLINSMFSLGYILPNPPPSTAIVFPFASSAPV